MDFTEQMADMAPSDQTARVWERIPPDCYLVVGGAFMAVWQPPSVTGKGWEQVNKFPISMLGVSTPGRGEQVSILRMISQENVILVERMLIRAYGYDHKVKVMSAYADSTESLPDWTENIITKNVQDRASK